MGIGVTATTTLIRINAALLFATRYLSVLGFKDSVIDNFWTITDYFNSLRELGGASTQILDDVQSRFSYLAKTKFKTYQPSINAGDKYDNLVELTSRMNNSEITRIIQDKLKRSYRDNGYHTDVFDFVLASNMISVGVDVGRLGIMVVAGQPKTNAEYIQASSRVGREIRDWWLLPTIQHAREIVHIMSSFYVIILDYINTLRLQALRHLLTEQETEDYMLCMCRFADI